MSLGTAAPRGMSFRKFVTGAAIGISVLLSGCVNSPNYSSVNTPFQPNINPGGQQGLVAGRVIGNGSVRIGLLLPYSGEGQSAASVATLFANSAKLALGDFQGADVQLLVKDTGGTAEGASMAAQQAINEGAELIIGPVFATAVQGATSVTRRAGVPIVAFSSDINVAKSGTYLLSYLPVSDVNRIVSYAAEQERRSFSALLPNNAYGAVAEAAFRQAVGQTNGRIVAIERYVPGNAEDIRARVANLSRSISQVDTLFVPEGGGVPPFVVQVMTEMGASLGEVKMIGSGQWNTPDILQSPVMVGSWFPGPDNQSFERLAVRYRETYGTQPPRNASLAYDATILAAGLVRSAGPDRFSDRVLTNRDGFLGIDGIFRFQQDGLNNRGLAVYAVSGKGNAEPIAPAPRSFAGQF
ncbi:penicillin-binding protein activator [Pseudovibrio sp. Tun.PSC04-5.I4]|uniref:penicillin-binding protein activator n=1 Tax=Pseudovibrio sp. Tun.PSC04-5.I4 TaxID=1798213 RepID=UPI000887AA38|nr:penicillin-binding protein activator [Pseudovibrio sp. Tun.PSC04-5.I4]SDR25828.1 ABC-type branched-chain amino acid transport system, substrate-binding protein [Pseudovibrio sp. Tun.PSC04-5.I4]